MPAHCNPLRIAAGCLTDWPPRKMTPADFARSFSEALQRPVDIEAGLFETTLEIGDMAMHPGCGLVGVALLQGLQEGVMGVDDALLSLETRQNGLARGHEELADRLSRARPSARLRAAWAIRSWKTMSSLTTST